MKKCDGLFVDIPLIIQSISTDFRGGTGGDLSGSVQMGICNVSFFAPLSDIMVVMLDCSCTMAYSVCSHQA